MNRAHGMAVLTVVCGWLLLAGCANGSAGENATLAEAQPGACTMRVATPVKLADVGQHPDRYIGRCIAVNAIFDGDELFTSVRAAKRADSGTIVGAFDSAERWDQDELTRGRFSGVLKDCRQSEQEAVARAEADGRVFLDIWVLGCQRGQRVHLVGLETADLVAVR